MLTQVTLYNDLRNQVRFFVQRLSLGTTLNKIGRKLALSLTDILTLGLFKQTAQIATKKKLWTIMEPACSYKTLVVSLNRFAPLALQILCLILKQNRTHAHVVKHIDSTDIPVCTNRKASHHRTMRLLSAWGKTGKGWFYGLKLHLIADLDGRLLAIKLTAGNVDDRSIVLDLADDINGIFVGDAGYLSESLGKEFYREYGRILLTKTRSNMKKLATQLDVWLYSTRMRIELNFRNLKCFFGFITSLPRSVSGYLANYTYSILAYLWG
jgi:hypothetical protein